MHFPFSAVGRIGNTREHAEGAGALHQAREGGASNLCLSCHIHDRGPGQHGFDGSQIAQKALSHRTFERGVIKGRQEARALIPLFLNLLRRNGPAFGQLRGKRIWENGKSVRGKTHQRRQPSQRDGGEIHEQMASGGALCASLPDRCFPLRLWPAFPETFDQFLHTGRLAPRPDDLQCLFKLWPGGKSLPPSMQKDQIGVTRCGQGGFCPYPIDPYLLFCHLSCRFCFGSIALAAFVLLQPRLRDQEPPIEYLTDGIGEVDMGLALKQVVDGERSRQGGGDLVSRSKRGTDIAASVPGHLGMIFEVQKELFFHLATERLPAGSALCCFPARNPSRDALSSNFEQVDATHAHLRHDLTSLFAITANTI